MRDKYYINLNDKEYFDALSSLVSKRNKLIQSGKYTDGIDEVKHFFGLYIAPFQSVLILNERSKDNAQL